MQKMVIASLVVIVAVMSVGCYRAPADSGKVFIVTGIYPFSWENSGYPMMILRKEGDKKTSVCLEGWFDQFEPGDRVIPEYIDVDRCLVEGEFSIAFAPEQGNMKTLLCEWIGNVTMLEYIYFLWGVDETDFVGVSIYVESDNDDRWIYTWWTMETSIENFLDPPMVGTEIVDGEEFDVYEYIFEIPSTLTDFVICGGELCSDAIFMTDFWYSATTAFFIGQKGCIVLE